MFVKSYPLTLTRKECTSKAMLCLAQATLKELEKTSEPWLHYEEKLIASNLTGRKASYLLGRYCAKKALRELIPSIDQDVWIGTGAFGQPILHGKINKSTQVSIAHADNLGAALVFDESQPMGIDLEINIPDRSSLIDAELTSAEKKLISIEWNLSSSIHPHPWIWSVKEGLAKTLKTGLTVPLSLYEINKIGKEGDFIYATYKNFPQYKAISFSWNNAIVTMTLPRKTIVSFI